MINSREIKFIRNIFLTKREKKYYCLSFIFSYDELLNLPVHWLFLQTKEKLQIKSNEIKFETFQSGFKKYRQRLKKEQRENFGKIQNELEPLPLPILKPQEREGKVDNDDWWKKVPSSGVTKKTTVELKPVLPGDYKND